MADYTLFKACTALAEVFVSAKMDFGPSACFSLSSRPDLRQNTPTRCLGYEQRQPGSTCLAAPRAGRSCGYTPKALGLGVTLSSTWTCDKDVTMRGKLFLLPLVAFAMLLTGCAHRSRPQDQNQFTYVNKPVIDFGRGGGGLPVEGQKQLKSATDLLAGLIQGYRSRLELPKDHDAVTVSGEFPHLDLLRVDLTDATLKRDFRPHQFKKPTSPKATAYAKKFEYVAQPIRYHDGPMEMLIQASDAELSVIRDGEKTTLVVTNASEGSFEFSMKVADIKPMLMAGAKEHATGGFNIRDLTFDAKSDSPRSLSVDLKVQATWLFVPADFHVAGRVDIDDYFNVRLSGLRCDGENLGGVLIAGFIDDQMQKHNGKVMPLAAWPGNKLRLNAAHIEVDDHIRIKGGFGPTQSIAKGN